MSRLSFLSSAEKRKFDSPPVLTKAQRPAYFVVTDDIRRTLGQLRTATNKVEFLLQLGYFKHSGKFFVPETYRRRDINYVKSLLHIKEDIDLKHYPPARTAQHRARILELMNWSPFNQDNSILLAARVQLLTQQQLKPEQVFLAAVDFCWKQRIEIPSYHQLSNVITESFNIVEAELLTSLESLLNPGDRTALDELAHVSNDQLKPMLDTLKPVSQSLRAKDIQKNVAASKTFGVYFHRFRATLETLNMQDQAQVYYATWVQKATMTQLKQFSNPHKRYLHLLAYVNHQYYERQDVLMDIFLKSVTAATNYARKQQIKQEQDLQSERREAITSITQSHKSSRQLLEEIKRVIKDSNLLASEQVAKIEQLFDDHDALERELPGEKLQQYERVLDNYAVSDSYYAALAKRSLSLQRRVSTLLGAIEFDSDSSQEPLLSAVLHFQSTDGNIGHSPPLDFLSDKVANLVAGDDGLRVSLYKILLFQAIADAVKAGKLNLKHSHRYRAIQDYLIPIERWREKRDHLLSLAGLASFSNGPAYLAGLKTTLDDKFGEVNQRYHAGDNTYLSVSDTGYASVRTPPTDFSEDGYIGSLLSQNGIVSVLQVLRDINSAGDFVHCFKHLSPKHHKLKPTAEIVIAGILGLGSNLGIDKLSQISVGINESTLKNTVNWCFSLENIQAANSVILTLIDKLALSKAFQKYPHELHTSSDGRKVGTAVDSLHANYSFKYFGKDKGVTMYTFIDERHALFHSTVISASDREAAYVIDGLMQNDVVKSDIHSTDTHGYSEAVFAATHMVDTTFAPRIKKLGSQRLYAFSSKSTYKKRGYAVLPSRTINQKLILRHWDDILRFMATIKLRHCSASQLFKRLSSYAKDHPLYQALKEFGRIIKTQFILTYLDDVELRQRIEKQINKIELANRFSQAVFHANDQEFQVGTKEEQEIATACKVLIQNAIVLWNYLYLSQSLSNAADLEERDYMLEVMTEGSILSWKHVNMQGEYDFTRIAANEDPFDLPDILALKLA